MSHTTVNTVEATRALTFPFSAQPAPGEAIEIQPGVYWLTTLLPFRLQAINQWLLRDDDGWTMVDCGYSLADVREQIEAVWARVLGGKSVTRLIVTHHHCDHIGNCRWMADRWGIIPTISRGEYEHAQRFVDQSWADASRMREAFYRQHGLSPLAAVDVNEQWRQLYYRPLPKDYVRLQDGDVLRIGGFDWHVMTVLGHAPEQAILYCPERNLLISGDQVLPKITPNVSVHANHPTEEPLALFLETNRRLAERCGDVMVLPSHKLPFLGLQTRVRQLEAHHEQRLARIESALNGEPKTAADVIPVIFGDIRNGHEVGFALGESIAHLHRLVADGRVKRMECDGQVWFTRSA